MKTKWEVFIVQDEKGATRVQELLNAGWNLAFQQPTDKFILVGLAQVEDTGIISPITPKGAQIPLKK